MATAGTVTLMFTDLVGSTRLLGELGEERAEAVMRRHFAVLRAEVARTGGREVKSLGDGLMIAFNSAVEAVDCAVAMQQATSEADDGLGLRVGLHAGEPSVDGDGDFFGTPVVVAQRLCARAQGGEILASEVVRGLVGTRARWRFEPAGDLPLKGMTEPVAATRLRWRERPELDMAATPPTELPPLPAALGLRRGTAFVGRTDALARLVARLDEVRTGRLRFVAISGEPGIGKTRLAREFAALAHDEDAVVMYGRAEEEGLVPYQPFAEAFRGYLQAVPAAAAAARDLGRLLPELEHRPETSHADPSLQRYLLFEAATSFLATVARGHPVVLVLDDLHWADAPTLLLLRHLVRTAASAPVLVLGTYRETDLSRRHPLAEALADLRRDNLIERVPLRGLGAEDVAELLAASAGHAVPDAFVRALHGETEGNPFFLEEVLRHLVESGAIYERDGKWTSDVRIEQMGIPEGIREAVGRRLARLSDTCNRALAAAAVIGRRWDFELLREMVDVGEEELLDAVEEALAAQLVVEADGSGHAFTHALVRETLYEELSLPRRQRMHLRAAAAIETRHARDLDRQASALALHLRLAGAAADATKALEWSLRAAEVTARALAWEEAGGHLDAALEHMEEAASPPADRARVLERLADLKYVAGFDLQGALDHLEQALQLYENAAMPDRAARVHSRIARDRSTFFGPTHDIPIAKRHLQAARPILEREARGAAMGFLLIAESTTALWELDMPGSQAAAEEAMAIAEHIGNTALWSNAATLAGNARGARGEVSAGIELVERAWQEADRINHPWLAFLATWTLAGLGLWLRGPRFARDACLRELEKPRVAGALGQRSFLRLFLGQAELEMGDTVAAERSIKEQPPPHWGFDAVVLAVRGHRAQAFEAFDRFLEESRASANLWTELAIGFRMCETLTVEGDPRSGPLLHEYCEMAASGDHRVLEAHARSLRAAFAPEWGERQAGLAELERCRRIVGNGDDWHQVAARVAWAAGAVLEDDSAAEAQFQSAYAILDRLDMELLRARVLRSHGIRLSGSDPARALERFDAALAIYESAGATDLWTDGIRRQRERAAALV